MPVAMAFAVVATANHFVIDVVVGVTLVLLAFALQRDIRSSPQTSCRDAGRHARPAPGTLRAWPRLETARPLSAEELARLDACWRAANYLSVGQIYLLDNPLLREPLALEHVKPRLLGHWGTTPGPELHLRAPEPRDPARTT